MTPAQIRRVRKSFATVALSLDEVSDAFYRHIDRLDPSRGPLFDGDPLAQRIRIGGALAGLVGALGQLDRIAPALAELGRQRACQGVPPEHYAWIKESLIAALQEVLADTSDAATQRAWCLAFDEVVRLMTVQASDVWATAQAA